MSGMLPNTKLYDRSGEAAVAEVFVPPFQACAEVVQWGIRTFVLRLVNSARVPAEARYCEVFCYYVPIPIQSDSRGSFDP